MNLDLTYCSGLRCNKTATCERWVAHLKQWLEANPEYAKPISISQFSDHDGKCDHYLPIEALPSQTVMAD